MGAFANKDLLEKAAILTSTGGQLTPEQAKKFISTVVDQSDMLKRISVQPMTANTFHIDVVEIASRQMRKATEGTDPGFTASVTIPRRSLSVVEVILPYDVSINFLEENIEREAAERTLNEKFAIAFGNDLLDLAINGDEASTDAFLQINDGWLKIAAGDAKVNSVTNTGTSDWLGTQFPAMLKALPAKYRRNPAELVFLVSPDVEEDYRKQLSNRATGLGDAYVTEARRAQYHGIDVYPAPFMPDNKQLLTSWKNLFVGIGRQMRVDRFLNARKRVIEYTITAKVDFNYAVSDLVVLGNV